MQLIRLKFSVVVSSLNLTEVYLLRRVLFYKQHQLLAVPFVCSRKYLLYLRVI